MVQEDLRGGLVVELEAVRQQVRTAAATSAAATSAAAPAAGSSGGGGLEGGQAAEAQPAAFQPLECRPCGLHATREAAVPCPPQRRDVHVHHDAAPLRREAPRLGLEGLAGLVHGLGLQGVREEQGVAQALLVQLLVDRRRLEGRVHEHTAPGPCSGSATASCARRAPSISSSMIRGRRRGRRGRRRRTLHAAHLELPRPRARSSGCKPARTSSGPRCRRAPRAPARSAPGRSRPRPAGGWT